MSAIGKFISSMMPQMSKREMKTNLDYARQLIVEQAIPSYTSAAEIFGMRELRGQRNSMFEKEFANQIRLRYKGNNIAGICAGLSQLAENIDVLNRLLDRGEDAVSRQAVSIMNVNLLQATETLVFLGEYAVRHLDSLLVCEVNTANGSKETAGMTMAELKWLDGNKGHFITAFRQMTIAKADVERRFKELPSVVVSEDNADIVASSTDKSTDAFKLGLIPTQINIFLRVGMFVAELQAAKFRRTIAQRTAIELRLAYLKSLDANQRDDITGNEIDIAQGRLDKLNAKIASMEEKWVVN